PGTPGHPGRPGTPGTQGHGTPVGSSHVGPRGTRSIVDQPVSSAGQLAHTGSDLPIGLVLPVGAGALLAGAVLYRKARPSA
ncbi:hypothetical protein ACFW2E_44215, partial [Streptomyces sp. NPDC058964]